MLSTTVDWKFQRSWNHPPPYDQFLAIWPSLSSPQGLGTTSLLDSRMILRKKCTFLCRRCTGHAGSCGDQYIEVQWLYQLVLVNNCQVPVKSFIWECVCENINVSVWWRPIRMPNAKILVLYTVCCLSETLWIVVFLICLKASVC